MRPSLDHLAKAYASYQTQRDVPAWLAEMQDNAWQSVVSQGLPNRKDEHWKYTSLFDLAKIPLSPPSTASTQNQAFESIYEAEECYLIELVNGRLTPNQQRLPQGLSIVSRHIREESAAFVEPARQSVVQDLNLAFADNLIEVHLDTGTVLDKPIYLKIITHGDQLMSAAQIHFEIGQQCQMQVVEHLCGDGDESLSTRRLSFSGGDNSHTLHTTVQVCASGVSSLGNIDVTLADHANYRSMYIDLGAKLARHDLGIALNGNGAECQMLGVFIPSGGQHFDHHTLVNHNVAHTRSEQIYHGIAGHKGHGVFNGKVFVQQDAQKISAEQSNKNILLSEHTHIDTKPELEIYADDVKCSHGATVGQLDDSALLYLRSRGIGKHQAQLILVRGFANEIYQHITSQKLQEYVATCVEHKLDQMLEELS